jgi:hypothetical protein
MATSNAAVLAKNCKNIVSGVTGLASSLSTGFATAQKIKARQWQHAPEAHRDQAEVWDTSYWKRHLCQHKNMWVDQDLKSEVSQKDLAQYMTAKVDGWKVLHCAAPLALTGGWGVPFAAWWFANDTFMPSTFSQTPAEVKDWRAAQDLQRYKHSPAALTTFKWWIEFHSKIPQQFLAGWDEVFEKNDTRRDPAKINGISKMYESCQPFHLIRREQARNIGRAMGIPTFPTFGKICLQARIKDYWEAAWNEDHMVISGKLHEAMSTEDLYDYAWRRYLAPYDKDLSRDELLNRVNDYHTFLGAEFVAEGKAPNIFLTVSYCLGNYNEPAYLDMDVAELETNDFDNLATWTKDAFIQRMEFENGPLRDQVEAHSHNKNLEREAKLAALAPAKAPEAVAEK